MKKKSKRCLEKLPSLYELDEFSLNSITDNNVNNFDSFPFISSKYYSPYSFEQMKSSLAKSKTEHNSLVFHSDIRSIQSNLKN